MPLSEEIELARYRDKRIAIDGAGWLYRGCYACARDLALVELGLVPKGSRSDPMAGVVRRYTQSLATRSLNQVGSPQDH